MNETIYFERRRRLGERMQPGVLILAAAEPKVRSNDTEYPYRQESNFYYLTGFEEDNALLMLVKDETQVRSVLFVQPKVPEMELWTGTRLGAEAAKARFEVDAVHSIEAYEAEFEAACRDRDRLYLDLFGEADVYARSRRICRALLDDRRCKRSPRTFIDATELTQAMRLIKDESEIALIRKALEITGEAHEAAMRLAAGGVFEYELQAQIEHCFKRMGAPSDAYTTIVAGGEHANTLHYIRNDAPLHEGELVLIDAGCEYGMYASDITRTFPVKGRFGKAQRELYELVLSVQESVIAMIRPGVTKAALQTHAERRLCEGMVALGILKGEPEALIEAKAHKAYFPHGIGHWMGLDVHDPCPYVDEHGEEIVLAPGMVMTIEPGLYLSASDRKVPKRYRGIGIRIEDNVLVTASGCENLSAHIPKTVEAVENVCRSKG